MIDLKTLVPINVKGPEGMIVAMAVEHEGHTCFMLAKLVNGSWVSAFDQVKLPPRLLGWTGIDNSWEKKDG